MSTSTQNSRIRVGIVGMRPHASWAAVAHLPALRGLGDDYEVVAVADVTLEGARAAAEAHDIPQAFGSVAEMVASPDIDLVVVTTRVPQHADPVRTALEAGKQVYCEWPLGRTLEEAVELAALARVKGRRTVTSSQARFSPVVRQLRQLIADGHIGRVLSTRISGHVDNLGPTVTDLAGERYLRERRNGANLLTIPFGHMMAALREVLGGIADVSATFDVQYPQVRVAGTDTTFPADAPDHIVVAGHLASGVPLSITYIGGTPPTEDGFIWDIRGTLGDLRITGPTGYAQIAPFKLWERLGTDTQLREIAAATDALQALGPVAGGVARGYQRFADDLRHGTHTAPDFDDAVALHRVLHAIERSAEEGIRIGIDDAGHVVQTGSASLEAA
jgi:predicted dehydrogenase